MTPNTKPEGMTPSLMPNPACKHGVYQTRDYKETRTENMVVITGEMQLCDRCLAESFVSMMRFE